MVVVGGGEEDNVNSYFIFVLNAFYFHLKKERKKKARIYFAILDNKMGNWNKKKVQKGLHFLHTQYFGSCYLRIFSHCLKKTKVEEK